MSSETLTAAILLFFQEGTDCWLHAEADLVVSRTYRLSDANGKKLGAKVRVRRDVKRRRSRHFPYSIGISLGLAVEFR